MGIAGPDRSDKEYGSGLELVVDWYGLRDDGSGYATKRQLVFDVHHALGRLFCRSFSGTGLPFTDVL